MILNSLEWFWHEVKNKILPVVIKIKKRGTGGSSDRASHATMPHLQITLSVHYKIKNSHTQNQPFIV